MKNSYLRFIAMITTPTLAMFVLMYLDTYDTGHVFFSETRAYMAVYMGAAMASIMLVFMLGMYASRSANIAILAGSVILFADAPSTSSAARRPSTTLPTCGR